MLVTWRPKKLIITALYFWSSCVGRRHEHLSCNQMHRSRPLGASTEFGSGFADCLAGTDALSAVETWSVWPFIGCIVLGAQGGEKQVSRSSNSKLLGCPAAVCFSTGGAPSGMAAIWPLDNCLLAKQCLSNDACTQTDCAELHGTY